MVKAFNLIIEISQQIYRAKLCNCFPRAKHVNSVFGGNFTLIITNLNNDLLLNEAVSVVCLMAEMQCLLRTTGLAYTFSNVRNKTSILNNWLENGQSFEPTTQITVSYNCAYSVQLVHT